MAISTGTAIGLGALGGGILSNKGGPSAGDRGRGRRDLRIGRSEADALLKSAQPLWEPYYQHGTNALNEGFSLENDPGIKYGIDAAMRRSNALGQGNSGNILSALQDASNRYATDAKNRWLSDVNLGLAGAGGKSNILGQRAATWSNTANALNANRMGQAAASQAADQWKYGSLNNMIQGTLGNVLLADYLSQPQGYQGYGSTPATAGGTSLNYLLGSPWEVSYE